MNNLTLMGRLGSEPAVLNTTNGTVGVRLSIGVAEKEARTESGTVWFEVTLWDRLAIIARDYWHTGDKVYVQGHLSASSFEDKEGTTRYVTRIEVDEIEKVSTARRNLITDEQSKTGTVCQ